MPVEFIETSIFTRQVKALIDDETYRRFQNFLLQQPDFGDTIQGTHGARKIRWSGEGRRGKSYGIRVIYVLRNERIYFLLAYDKTRKADLTSDERKTLGSIIKNLG